MRSTVTGVTASGLSETNTATLWLAPPEQFKVKVCATPEGPGIVMVSDPVDGLLPLHKLLSGLLSAVQSVTPEEDQESVTGSFGFTASGVALKTIGGGRGAAGRVGTVPTALLKPGV
ncbi:MAG: hypothetical protein AAB737_03690 [Patescibacteria group bacterium]